MNQPPREPPDGAPPPDVTRRAFIALGVVVAASTATGTALFRADPAAAAVSWGHPFATRQAAGSRFGIRRGRMHQGQDYPAPIGTPIYAVADGTVSAQGVLGTGGAYGNAVFLSHADGWSSRYAHMRAPSALRVGDRVVRGSLIGLLGNTGRSTGPHLHLELRTNGRAVDPYPLVQSAPLAVPGGAHVPAAAAPTPPPQPQEDDMAYAISVGGQSFTVSPQFISHHGSASQATVTRKVISATDELQQLNGTQFSELLDGLGIPREVVRGDTVLDPHTGQYRRDGVWSREREILAAIARLGS